MEMSDARDFKPAALPFHQMRPVRSEEGFLDAIPPAGTLKAANVALATSSFRNGLIVRSGHEADNLLRICGDNA